VISSFCAHNSLQWLDHDTTLGVYTFHNDLSDKYSLIDHFVCSSDVADPSCNISILRDDDNLSDHYAIMCHFMTSAVQPVTASTINCDRGMRLDWDKADISYYHSRLLPK